MHTVTPEEGLTLLTIFGVSMLGLVLIFGRRSVKTHTSFLLANREVGWVRGAFSIAVSWIWAPAIFIASLQSYTKGAAGAFWFIVPNVACFFLFAVVAVRVRRLMPEGFTLPEYMLIRFKARFPVEGRSELYSFLLKRGVFIADTRALRQNALSLSKGILTCLEYTL